MGGNRVQGGVRIGFVQRRGARAADQGPSCGGTAGPGARDRKLETGISSASGRDKKTTGAGVLLKV